MSHTEIIAIIISALSISGSITALISWRNARIKQHKNEGATEMRTTASLDIIKLQNENILAGNREICAKLDDQGIRLVKLEQTVENANLAAIPAQIARIEASAKSAHNRIDRLEKIENGGKRK